MAGSKPGERRGGRQKGTPNKATADVKAQAGQYTTEALATLAKIMKAGKSEQARVAAANAILDRAHGKPKQAVDVATPDPTTGESVGLSEALGWIGRALGRDGQAPD